VASRPSRSRDITNAVFCQGPYDESSRYRDFMGWDMPWYAVQGSLDVLLAGRQASRMYIVCYLRDGDRVFETYWTTVRGVEARRWRCGRKGAPSRSGRAWPPDTPMTWATPAADRLRCRFQAAESGHRCLIRAIGRNS